MRTRASMAAQYTSPPGPPQPIPQSTTGPVSAVSGSRSATASPYATQMLSNGQYVPAYAPNGGAIQPPVMNGYPPQYYNPQTQIPPHQQQRPGAIPGLPPHLQKTGPYAQISQQQQHLAQQQQQQQPHQLQQQQQPHQLQQQHPQQVSSPQQNAQVVHNVTAIPIMTPGNSPHAFQTPYYNPAMRQQSQQQLLLERRQNEARSGGTVYGYGLTGVPTLQRILMSLQCGIESEEKWALASLVHTSFASAEKFSLKYNDVLAEVLLRKIVDSHGGKKNEVEVDSKSTGPIFPFDTTSASDTVLAAQQRIIEALLVVRNFAVESDNAEYLGKQKLCQDVVAYGLDTTNEGVNNEYLHYCVEILESVSFYIIGTTLEDPLLQSISKLVATSTDRSIAVPALRSLSRLLIRDEKNIAGELPHSLVAHIMRYLLTRDYELLAAALDFLYQYTAQPVNVSKLISGAVDTPAPAPVAAVREHLVRLLTYGMTPPEPVYVRQPRRTPKPVPENPPLLGEVELRELLALNEPERATQWIRTCYENESTGEVTQISLWKAYEAQFEPHARAGGVRLLPAVDFIKNVTAAFQNSAAMVVNTPDGKKRFIIKGIQPRAFAVAPSLLRASGGGRGADDLGDKAGDKAASSRPPVFGATAALVLQNIARGKDGKRVLRPATAALVNAALVNPAVSGYVGEILILLDSPTEEEETL